MEVRKTTVEQFVFHVPVVVISQERPSSTAARVTLSADDARELHDKLGEALGRSRIESWSCGDRYSHGPHVELGRDGVVKFCRGHSFDQT